MYAYCPAVNVIGVLLTFNHGRFYFFAAMDSITHPHPVAYSSPDVVIVLAKFVEL